MITVSLASQAKSLTFSSTVTGTPSTASALQYCTSAGAIGDSLISQGSITGRLTLSKSGTTARTVTFPDASITVAGTNLAQTWTATQTFAAINATTVTATSGSAGTPAVVAVGASATQGRIAFGTAADYGIHAGADYLGMQFWVNGAQRVSIDATSGAVVIGPSDPGGSEIVRVDGSGRFSGAITCASLTSSGGSTPSDPASGAVAIGNGTIKAYNEITVTDGTLRLRLYPANLQLHRTGAASYTDITGIGGTYVIRTSNAASLDTTALTFAANGAATFGSGITCTTLTASGGATPGAATSGQTLLGNGTIRTYGNIHSETGSFLLASGGAIYAGGNLAAAFYPAAPGTPGGTEVLIGGGQIKTGAGITCGGNAQIIGTVTISTGLIVTGAAVIAGPDRLGFVQASASVSRLIAYGTDSATPGLLSLYSASSNESVARESAAFDGSSAADDTRFLLYDVTAGALKRVTRGAADSAGTGYRTLRIAN